MKEFSGSVGSHWNAKQHLRWNDFSVATCRTERPLSKGAQHKFIQGGIRTVLDGELFHLSFGVDDRIGDDESAGIFPGGIGRYLRTRLIDRERQNHFLPAADTRDPLVSARRIGLTDTESYCPCDRLILDGLSHVKVYRMDLFVRENPEVGKTAATAS